MLCEGSVLRRGVLLLVLAASACGRPTSREGDDVTQAGEDPEEGPDEIPGTDDDETPAASPDDDPAPDDTPPPDPPEAPAPPPTGSPCGSTWVQVASMPRSSWPPSPR